MLPFYKTLASPQAAEAASPQGAPRVTLAADEPPAARAWRRWLHWGLWRLKCVGEEPRFAKKVEGGG